jgi:hypothetical protein
MDIKSLQDNKIKYFHLKFMQFGYSAVSHMNKNVEKNDKCMK